MAERCPDCAGEGEVPVGVGEDYDSGQMEARDVEPCSTCNGSGEVQQSDSGGGEERWTIWVCCECRGPAMQNVDHSKGEPAHYCDEPCRYPAPRAGTIEVVPTHHLEAKQRELEAERERRENLEQERNDLIVSWQRTQAQWSATANREDEAQSEAARLREALLGLIYAYESGIFKDKALQDARAALGSPTTEEEGRG